MLQTKVIDKERVLLKEKGQIFDEVPFPDLLAVQIESYENFLQKDIRPEERDPDKGLEAIFKNIFPITTQDGSVILDYMFYEIEEPEISEAECIRRSLTYAYSVKATFKVSLLKTREIREKTMLLFKIPAMTQGGYFIFNGVERVIIQQIHRTPGVLFSFNEMNSSYLAKIIPEKGSWLEFEIDTQKDLFFVHIDRKKKLSLSTFLRVLGFETKEDMIRAFHDIISLDVHGEEIKKLFLENDKEIILAESLTKKGEVVLEAGYRLSLLDLERIQKMGEKTIHIIDPLFLKKSTAMYRTIEQDEFDNVEEAAIYLYQILHPGNTFVSPETAIKELRNFFNDIHNYDLGVIGRYKFNLRLYPGEKNAPEVRNLCLEDIVRVVKYLLRIYREETLLDDLDHLGNRRVRGVGELLAAQIQIGFMRMERVVRERMVTEDTQGLHPHRLISVKYLTGAIDEFFGTSPFSQFMEQLNPLAGLTHMRRISALGKGGLTRERAGFEVRDVHFSHYGRLCPIETPEGQNIGLILSLSAYAQVNDKGFLLATYRVVKQGKVTPDLVYLTPIEEANKYIGQVNTRVDAEGKILDEYVVCRYQGDVLLVEAKKVDYLDISPKQIFSVSTGLIPFLEHDDANRALMGSNMQRQAVPLEITEAPYVGTGLERIVVEHSRVSLQAKVSGTVVFVDNANIQIQTDDGEVVEHELIKMRKTNQNTWFNQRPLVKLGQKVEKGEIISDGPAVDGKEIALGKNILIAFMPWDGYNFEDAIVISERLLEEDAFTSIVIKEFRIEARNTKRGKEEITADIPHVLPEATRHLDENGIVVPGTAVRPRDILVGRITPKAQKELTPEYKLLYSIFGEKARDVKDTSLYVPYGVEGVVVKVEIFEKQDLQEFMTGIEKIIKVYVAQRRKIRVGDKLAGRHGNKGVVSTILPKEDMPFLPDGTPVDIVLNPLGVPSRMNIGQILELLLGYVAYKKGEKYETPIFEGLSVDKLKEMWQEVGLDEDGKTRLTDGRTGEPFEDKVTVGFMYMLKLNHMVDDKMHARSTGPYSLIVQQPLGGKSQFGGQRVGEMEVWAFEAYGASYTLQELLTVKSDDVDGRAQVYESLVEGHCVLDPNIPESFNVIVQELRGLALDLQIYGDNDVRIPFKEKMNIDRSGE